MGSTVTRAHWLLLVIALATIDATTRLALHTDAWAWHERQSDAWRVGGGITVLALAVAAMLPVGLARIPLAYALIGVAGNVADSLDGQVANPFIIQSSSGLVAFNFADVCLLGSIATAALIALAWLARASWRRLV